MVEFHLPLDLEGPVLHPDYLAHLLSLFSIQKLHQYFSPKEKKKHETITEIANSSPVTEIEKFAYLHHSTTKHHLHLFTHDTTELSLLNSDLTGLTRLAYQESANNKYTWFYLIDLSYNIVLNDPLSVESFKMPWPILIQATPSQLMLRFTTLEPSMASRYGASRIVRITRDLEEATILAQVLGNLKLSAVAPLDLNRGVKALWSEDLIDSPSVQWKKSRATTRQVMDGDYLVRRDDPTLYQELIDKPIFSGLFKWIGGGNISVDHFLAEATQGKLSFRTYSDLGTGADHVVREILARN